VHVLVVSPTESNRAALERELEEWGHEVLVAADALTAWSHLEEGTETPSLVLIDQGLSGSAALDLCREIRRTFAPEPYIYIVLLGAAADRQRLEEVHAAGADDYVAGPMDSFELQMRLRSAQRILRLQASLQKLREKMREQSTRDTLTGLWNRPAILDILETEMERVRREGGSLGVVMMDLDHFKEINDTRGHLVGDAVLREVGRRMRVAGRRYDLMGRYGGDEFLVVVPGCSLSQARSIANRLRARISETPMDLAEGTLFITSTAGATAWSKGDAQPNELIKLADQALYLAKGRGRNRAETVPHIPKGHEPLRRYRSLKLGRSSEDDYVDEPSVSRIHHASPRPAADPMPELLLLPGNDEDTASAPALEVIDDPGEGSVET